MARTQYKVELKVIKMQNEYEDEDSGEGYVSIEGEDIVLLVDGKEVAYFQGSNKNEKDIVKKINKLLNELSKEEV